MRAIVSPSIAAARMGIIFPREAFDTTLSSNMAGHAIAAMIYADAVVAADGSTAWTRPVSLIWQREAVLQRDAPEDRRAWAAAVTKGRAATQKVLEDWDITEHEKFAENSRETLRKGILGALSSFGAVRERAGLATNSSAPRWALEPHFADLFDPSLDDVALLEQVERWSEMHLDAGARLRAQHARSAEQRLLEVVVTLPDGDLRRLEPSESSRILKGVIEEWAARRLVQPVVLSISEPGEKFYSADRQMLAQLGVTIDVGKLLPDALIADIGTDPVEFWVIEAVSTDGPITDHRKQQLLTWATEHNIRPSSCRFLTAFTSRNASPAKRRLKDLAEGTFAWYADEPDYELEWRLIDGALPNITPLRPPTT